MRRRLPVAVLAAGALLALPAAAPAASTTLVVNEIDYDQPGTDTAEFLEIRNNSTTSVNLDPYRLQFGNGSDNAPYLSVELPSVEVEAGGHYVVCGAPGNVSGCDLAVGAESNLIQNELEGAAILNGDTNRRLALVRGRLAALHRGNERADRRGRA